MEELGREGDVGGREGGLPSCLFTGGGGLVDGFVDAAAEIGHFESGVGAGLEGFG